MKPTAICFDLDDTLLDGSGFQRSIALACEEIGRAHGFDSAALLEANTATWAAYVPEIGDGWTLGRVTGADVNLEGWRRTLAACNCDDEEIIRAAVEIHARLAFEGHRLYDDAVELLACIADTMPLALITNGASDTQRDKLRALQLDTRFGATIISGDLGFAKPDAAIFNLALQGLGVAAHEAWHIGDNLHADIAGARNAGLTSVWVNRRGEDADSAGIQPHIEVASLSELVGMLR